MVLAAFRLDVLRECTSCWTALNAGRGILRIRTRKHSIYLRSTIFAGLFLLFFISLPFRANAETISITFDPATPVAGTSVSFNSNALGAVSNDVVSRLLLQTANTQDGRYTIMVDTESYHRDKFRRFSFDCYVKATSEKSSTLVNKFSVWEEPVGKFADLLGPVTAHVSGADGSDVVVIQLPEHSDDSPNVVIAVPDKPYPVAMGHSSRMDLGLSSNLSNLHLVIDPVISVVATKCPECWGPFSAKVLHDHLGVNQPTSLIIDLQPNTLKAFRRNLIVFDSNASQEELVGTVSSKADEGGLDVPQDFRVLVRFTPPGGFLFLSVLCGALIGCAIRYLISIQAPPKLSLLEGGITVLTAVIAWLLVLGLFATKTKATILGYELDPTQVIPAGLLALIAAGGTPFSSRLAQLLGR